ncbi:WecB/TagA/CpsF family glycosyltransferase [Clostridium sp. LIBA-8841]|uniref:WecB/TagA/CpsF family glycosyltransferase n=1 Tax=Clostridium sp. LIBA-8841 TaxID=2987530 RepID=UPI002AC38BE3|nr:WecB/TagA/CpsF family glycosyltransferase [Clostridium sp. LIBA-8841]MDZ5253628.1 WecB/TagA/CpsF family glycosyltransferase [Clostridium sp. LIBA-8841]
MKVNILDVPFDNISSIEALERLLSFLKSDKNHLLITPNPEIVMEAQSNKLLFNIINEADLVIPDGIGIVLASKLLKDEIKERVAGCDLIFELFDAIKETDETIYLLGAKPGVAKKAQVLMEEKYKNLKIVGVHDGYFDKEEEQLIIEEIQRLKPSVLLVELGCPRQEEWIYRNKDILPVKISAGIGGSIDIMAGTVKRAPIIFRKLNLEWLHRIILEPSRIFRIKKIPIFLIRVIRFKEKNTEHK